MHQLHPAGAIRAGLMALAVALAVVVVEAVVVVVVVVVAVAVLTDHVRPRVWARA